MADRRTDRDGRGHTATRHLYADCRNGAEVVLWKLTGAGHVWPGGKAKFMERILGPSSDIIDANQEMWNFYQTIYAVDLPAQHCGRRAVERAPLPF